MDPKTERKLQKTITKLNITPEDLKEFLKMNEAEDEEVNKLVEEANAEKEEPEKKQEHQEGEASLEPRQERVLRRREWEWPTMMNLLRGQD